MRSRFSAFVWGDAAHLVRSWHPEHRPRQIHLDPERTWTRLEVLATSQGGLLDDRGTVEFRAHHRSSTVEGVLHELSSFSRVNGLWVYETAVDRA